MISDAEYSGILTASLYTLDCTSFCLVRVENAEMLRDVCALCFVSCALVRSIPGPRMTSTGGSETLLFRAWWPPPGLFHGGREMCLQTYVKAALVVRIEE
jgi:hypothetical protein